MPATVPYDPGSQRGSVSGDDLRQVKQKEVVALGGFLLNLGRKAVPGTRTE
jgi:hypothetical protein